jgi:hypothetical protein
MIVVRGPGARGCVGDWAGAAAVLGSGRRDRELLVVGSSPTPTPLLTTNVGV